MYSYKGTFLGNSGAWPWSPNRIVKSEMDALGENYIVTKALMAFVKQGYIPKVFPHFIHKILSVKHIFLIKGELRGRGD